MLVLKRRKVKPRIGQDFSVKDFFRLITGTYSKAAFTSPLILWQLIQQALDFAFLLVLANLLSSSSFFLIYLLSQRHEVNLTHIKHKLRYSRNSPWSCCREPPVWRWLKMVFPCRLNHIKSRRSRWSTLDSSKHAVNAMKGRKSFIIWKMVTKSSRKAHPCLSEVFHPFLPNGPYTKKVTNGPFEMVEVMFSNKNYPFCRRFGIRLPNVPFYLTFYEQCTFSGFMFSKPRLNIHTYIKTHKRGRSGRSTIWQQSSTASYHYCTRNIKTHCRRMSSLHMHLWWLQDV